MHVSILTAVGSRGQPQRPFNPRPVAKQTAGHTHAKKGGGKLTHTHAFDPADLHGHEDALPLPEAAGEKALGMAELTTKARNKLDNSDFAWVDDDGTGHLPLNDAAHVRNAAARFTQTQFPDAATKKKAAAAIRAAAKRLGVDLDDDSPVMQMAEGPALIAVAAQQVDLSEGRHPYLATGRWEFPDYGVVDVDAPKLRSIVQHFRDNVRGQDLPLLDVDHVDPVYRGLALGWVKDLVPDDPETPTRIDMVYDLNEAGEALKAGDRVRYFSPTLLCDWTDPASGVTYPFVAAGVDVRTREEDGSRASAGAFTNQPRLKSLGRIACAEDGTPRAALLAMGEVTGATPARAARLLMQEANGDGDGSDAEDDDGPVPPCVYQPGQPATPSCPGFTRWPGDDDGDGTCLMATRGCNGYRAVQDDGTYQPPWQFSEGRRMPDDGAGQTPASQPPPAAQQAPTQAPVAPGTAPPVQPAPQPAQVPSPDPTQAPAPPASPPPATAPPSQTAADNAETQVIRAAEVHTLTQRVQASEQRATQAEARVTALEGEIRQMRMAERLGQVGDRITACLRTGRIDKATYDRLTEPTRLATFAEGGAMDVVLETIEALPAGHAVPMGEVGSGAATPPGQDQRQQAAETLTTKANAIMEAARQRGQRMSYSEATKQAARETPDAASVLAERVR